MRSYRMPLNVDQAAIVGDRLSGASLTKVAKEHGCSRATVSRLVKDPRLGSLATSSSTSSADGTVLS
jgi:hypothetical protein